jgi:glucose/arabinose dehydrogenase
VLVLAALVGSAWAARDPAGTDKIPRRAYKLTQIGRFELPTHLTAPPADTRRLFVVEKAGAIRVVLDGRVLKTPFLDLRSVVRSTGNEQGLLSLAFAPDYATSGRFYVYYVDLDENARLVEYRRSSTLPNRADPSTRREVLLIKQPSGEHYGGLLLFGPDGSLYLSLGDGGLERERDPLRAQRDDDLHGKILRIDPLTGAVEAWVKGLRNPWRYWIDRESGDLWIGDVGEFVRESIEYAPHERAAGTNFGWPCFEGNLAKPDYPPNLCPGAVPPLLEYAREGGNCSVIGGLVVRDPRLPRLAGRFLYADYCLGELISVGVADGVLTTRTSLRLYRPSVSSFGEDGRRRVYLVTMNGPVYRLDPRPAGSGASGTPKPRSGRDLFLSSGCGTCHILARAGTAGTYGPNLDEARPSRELVVERVTWGKNAMPEFGGRLMRAEIERIADFVVAAAGR